MAKQRRGHASISSGPPVLTATIDLHGYRKSEGIKTLTSFLEGTVSKHRRRKNCTGDVWVLVVTGSGAHSPEGPVLRSAVENLLQKRQMEFIVNRGKGSFTVKANSGIVFYEPDAPVDTKLIIRDAPERIPSLPTAAKFRLVRGGLLDEDESPTPNEVAATDKAFEESRKYHEKSMQEAKKEENMMKRAVSMSMLEAKKDEEEEEAMVHRAMSMSLLERRPSEDEFDEELRKALELSQKDLQTSFHTDSEAGDLEAALELSRTIMTREDEELLKIMELSKKEHAQDDLWLQNEAKYEGHQQTW
mmetsp:Transcript_66963/g.193519  ORF Transcript_66963/g.193519 Transcript_66963/m.193519 type:complete len:303 (-) Transcript_66963:60-968(-)